VKGLLIAGHLVRETAFPLAQPDQWVKEKEQPGDLSHPNPEQVPAVYMRQFVRQHHLELAGGEPIRQPGRENDHRAQHTEEQRRAGLPGRQNRGPDPEDAADLL
jgi:hypothetical protein